MKYDMSYLITISIMSYTFLISLALLALSSGFSVGGLVIPITIIGTTTTIALCMCQASSKKKNTSN